MSKKTVIRWTAAAEALPPSYLICYVAVGFRMIVGTALYDHEAKKWLVPAADRPCRQDFDYWCGVHDLIVEDE